MKIKNGFYAQSGGCTAVINATACGLIETARQHRDKINNIYAGQSGILGGLLEELIDLNQESDETIRLLKQTPGAIFGSCRYKLKSFAENQQDYLRLFEVFTAHNIHYFFYNGGGDSQDTTYKISQAAEKLNYDLICMGLPKTIDNDILNTDNCPGFGSVAKFIATTTRETGLDVLSMSSNSTKVFIYEVMGRHTGWIAAASGLAAEDLSQAPHIILFPEIIFDQNKFLDKINNTIKNYGYCVIVTAEGIKGKNQQFLTESPTHDAFGHAQLGGVAPYLALLIKNKLGLKSHWAVADYIQRAARHLAAKTDVEQAYQIGQTAIEAVLNNQHSKMLTIQRLSDTPYRWEISTIDLKLVANQEKYLPKNYISQDGFQITAQARNYLTPLILGEDYPEYNQQSGLPIYAKLNNQLIPKKLSQYKI